MIRDNQPLHKKTVKAEGRPDPSSIPALFVDETHYEVDNFIVEPGPSSKALELRD